VRNLACAVLVLAAVTACGGNPESNAERFCGEAIENRNDLVAPSMADEDDVEATLELYRMMSELAPIAIAAEWNDVVVSLETASSLVPGDPESEQLVAKTAYATEPSAFAVKTWLLDNCKLDIPITTIAPQADVPARTTTIVTVETTTPSDG